MGVFGANPLSLSLHFNFPNYQYQIKQTTRDLKIACKLSLGRFRIRWDRGARVQPAEIWDLGKHPLKTDSKPLSFLLT